MFSDQKNIRINVKVKNSPSVCSQIGNFFSNAFSFAGEVGGAIFGQYLPPDYYEELEREREREERRRY